MLLQVLFLAGVALTIGPPATLRFFMRRKNYKGSGCFLSGVGLVVWGWTFVGEQMHSAERVGTGCCWLCVGACGVRRRLEHGAEAALWLASGPGGVEWRTCGYNERAMREPLAAAGGVAVGLLAAGAVVKQQQQRQQDLCTWLASQFVLV